MAGDSAHREYERIRDLRWQRIRDNRTTLALTAALALLGGSLVGHFVVDAWWLGAVAGVVSVGTLLFPGQREHAWRKGAEGEKAVGRALDRLGGNTVALHDRRIPESRANIDHILIAPTGVWTIDAKHYSGKLEVRHGGQELWVKGRNRSKLLNQARRQTEVVRGVLAEAGRGIPTVTPVLCFVGAEWPLIFRPEAAGDVRLVSPRRLRRLTDGPAKLSISEMKRISDVLDRRLRPATDGAAAGTDQKMNSKSSHVGASAEAPDRAPASDDLEVKPWKRYGHHRLYVNRPNGTTLGYADLATNEIVVEDERHRSLVERAIADHLRHR